VGIWGIMLMGLMCVLPLVTFSPNLVVLRLMRECVDECRAQEYGTKRLNQAAGFSNLPNVDPGNLVGIEPLILLVSFFL
jgi:hypothetical protein